MLKEVRLKYPDGRIRLPVDYQFEYDSELVEKLPPSSDLESYNQVGEIVGAFSGNLWKSSKSERLFYHHNHLKDWNYHI